MLRSRTPLLVFPVPFAALDAEGMPAASVRFDPPMGRKNEVHFIGCTLERKVVEKRTRAEGRQTLYETAFHYELSPQSIPHTDYHVQRIRHGELLAADAATAKRVGVPFVPPTQAFERARHAAIAAWTDQYGEPPPIERWPALCLVLPDGEPIPPTAPAHGASLRARDARGELAAPKPDGAAEVVGTAGAAAAALQQALPVVALLEPQPPPNGCDVPAPPTEFAGAVHATARAE